MVHVVAFPNTVQRCGHNKAEIQKDKGNAHKSLGAGVHGVGNQFVEHGRAPGVLEVVAGTGSSSPGRTFSKRGMTFGISFLMPV